MQEVKTRTNQPVSGVDKVAKEIVDQAIQADKDIISQIKMNYIEEDDYTEIVFPKGVMPLSITINTHELFLNGKDLVDNQKREVEGYILTDYYFSEEKVYLEIAGDLTEQVINNLSYILVNKTPQLITNTYNLFFPQPSGTKLYKHAIALQGRTHNFIANKETKITENVDNTAYWYACLGGSVSIPTWNVNYNGSHYFIDKITDSGGETSITSSMETVTEL